MENKTENKLIKYDFTSIVDNKQYAKALYLRAYKHFLLKKNDETYFADTLNNCKYFKLSKKYNKNNIVVLPIHYDNETKEFNKSNDLIIDKFLTPIVSKLMNIVFDDCFKINFYNTFKYKYFIPILEAEYSRMAKEDLDYNNEKPFIICIESAISSFLNNEEYVNSISDKVLNKLKKSLKNFKFVPVTISNTKENIIGDPLKLLDYFTTTRNMISKNEFYKLNNKNHILVDVSNVITNYTKEYYIYLDNIRFSIPSILDYILRMCLIEIIREHSILDVSAYVTDDVIENIKNELFIYNSRTAKVIKDYLIKFRSNYDYFFTLQTKQTSYKLITDMFNNITSDEKHLYKDDTIKTYQTQDPVSTSVAATTKLYTMISTMESMNRDYMKSNCSIVDINTMHGAFEMISKNMKDVVELRNEFFNLIYMNPDIFLDKWYPEHKSLESYEMTNNFFTNCINDVITYEKAGPMYKDYVLHHLVEGLRSIYFKDIGINACPIDDILAHDKENGFEPSKYNNLIDQLFVIIEKLSSNFKNISSLYLENILPNIQHWSATMENNVRYYQFFNSVNEYKQYNNRILIKNEDFDFYSFDFFKRT